MKGTAERQALPPAFMRGEGHEVAGGVPRGGGESLLSHGFAVPAPPEGKPRGLRPVPAPRIYEGGGPRSGRGSFPAAAAGKASSVTAAPCQLPQRGSRGRFAPFLPPAFMRGEGHEVAGGVPRGGGESLLSHGFAVPAPPEGKPRGLRPVPAPRIYEGGGPRSGRGSFPAAAAGKASSVTAAPCQLPQRGSRGRFAPFLPPAFMRGEGHEVAGGVPRGGGESLLSHGFAVPAPPEGKPRGLRSVLAPRIYEGGGPRSGRGSPPPQRESPLSHASRASSPGGGAGESPCSQIGAEVFIKYSCKFRKRSYNRDYQTNWNPGSLWRFPLKG